MSLSTHAIARGGVVQLHRWGLLESVIHSGAPEIRTAQKELGPAIDSHAGELARRPLHTVSTA
jgi:hypothetical protein